MVQTWNTVQRLLSAASLVRDAAFETKTLEFLALTPLTFYLDTQDSEVVIRRWPQTKISVRTRLQVGFGWYLQSDQDEVGVYIVAKRKVIIGRFSRAEFDIFLPETAHVVLKLTDSIMMLDGVSGTFQIPPNTASTTPKMLSSGAKETTVP